MRDITGKIFGSLKVLNKQPSNSEGRAVWHCVCKCGNAIDVTTKRLTTGKQTACKNCQDSGSKSPINVRLKKYIVASNGCWIWTGKKNKLGYGTITVNGVETRAHRAMYFMLNPDSDKNKVVMHVCDNPSCINPEHLKLGTQKENLEDMRTKGRGKGGAPKGNKNAKGNTGWTKGGIVHILNRVPASKLGDEVEVPDELVKE